MGAEKLVRKSETYNLLFNMFQGYLILINKTGKILDINENAIKDSDYTKEEIIGKSLKDLVNVGNLASVLKGLANSFAGGKSIPTDVEIKKKNGGKVNLRTAGRSVFVYDKSGKVEGLLIFGVNTTELKENEDMLRESQEKNKLLADSITEGIYSTSPMGLFVSVNKAMCDMFGYSEKELIGMQAWDLAVPEIREETKKDISKRVINNDKTPLEVLCVRKDGSKLVCEIKAETVLKDWTTFGTVLDITQKKKSENMYKELFEHFGDGIWVIDNQLKVIEANPKIADMLGYTREELIGKNILNFYADDGVEDSVRRNLKTTINGTPLYIERRFVTKSGKIIDVAINTKNVPEQGDVIIESIRNITEIKELKSKVKKLEIGKKIKLTDKEKIVFYGISRWPEASDQELSKIFKIKRSTVTAIKNKLKREKYYSVARIPAFNVVNCGLVCLTKHKFNKESKPVEKFSPDTLPELVFHVSAENDSLSITVGKDFSSLKEEVESFTANYEDKGVIKEVEQIYFPLDKTQIARCMDFSAMLKETLGLDLYVPEPKKNKPAMKKKIFTEKEKKILYALLKYPDQTDTFIANKTGTARATVSSFKKNMLDTGTLKTVIIPDFSKLGDMLLIFSHGFIGGENQIDSLSPTSMPEESFIRIVGSKEIVDFSMYKDYETFKKRFDDLSEKISNKWPNVKKPEYIALPISTVNELYMDFARVIKKCFGIRE